MTAFHLTQREHLIICMAGKIESYLNLAEAYSAEKLHARPDRQR